MAPRAVGGGVSRGHVSRGADDGYRDGRCAASAGLAKSFMVGSGLGFGSLYQASAEDGDPNPRTALLLALVYGAAEF